MNTSKGNEGHRQRLREKFLKNGLDGFLDYEIIELLLTLGTPRSDCKQSAKDATKKIRIPKICFGSDSSRFRKDQGYRR